MQKRFFLPPVAIVVFILYFTVFGDRGLLRIHRLNRDRDEMQQHLTLLKGENDKLKREIAALQSDKRYLESIARRDFGLVRSNETIYQFPSADKPQPKVQAGQAAPQQGAAAGPGGEGKGSAPAKTAAVAAPGAAQSKSPAGPRH